MTLKWNRQTMILAAIALVVLLLVWGYWSALKPKVLDPSDSKELSDLFDKMNPGVVSTPAQRAQLQAMGFGSMPSLTPIFISSPATLS